MTLVLIKSFILTIQFLTRIPVKINVDFDKKSLSKSMVFFPFVGCVIGLMSGFIYYGFSFINISLASVMAVFSLTVITGGLHLDGLADTADGLLSSRPKERVLEIMKDSRIGTFGSIALIFDVLLKYILIKELPPAIVMASLVFSCGNGRVCAAYLISYGKNARPGGLGDMFKDEKSKLWFLIGLAVYMILGIFALRVLFLIPFACSIVLTLIIKRWSYKTIDGITGDVCGSASEAGEIVSLLALLVVMQWT
jgi:adenosylcobinamide-GDP ribazoletransferase